MLCCVCCVLLLVTEMAALFLTPHIRSLHQLETVRSHLKDHITPSLPGTGTRSQRMRSSRLFVSRLREILELEVHPPLDDEDFDTSARALGVRLRDLVDRSEVDDLLVPVENLLSLPMDEQALPSMAQVGQRGREEGKERDMSWSDLSILSGFGIVALIVLAAYIGMLLSTPRPLARSPSRVINPGVDAFVERHPDFADLGDRIRDTFLAHSGRRALGIHLAATNTSRSLQIARDLVQSLERHIHYTHHPDSRQGGGEGTGGCRAHGSYLSMCRVIALTPEGKGKVSVLDQVTDALLLHEKTLFILDATHPDFVPFDINSLVGSLLDDSLPYIVTRDGHRLQSSKAMLLVISAAASPRDSFIHDVEHAFATGHAPHHRAADYVLKQRTKDQGWDDRLLHRLSASLPVIEDYYHYIKVWTRPHQ